MLEPEKVSFWQWIKDFFIKPDYSVKVTDDFHCPHCGADFPCKVSFDENDPEGGCPECGGKFK